MPPRLAREDFLRLEGLPTPSFVAATLLERALGESVSPQDLAEWIALDPSLAARVLRAVNSPAEGLRVEIASLLHAATILGTKRLRAILLGVRIAEEPSEGGNGALDPARLWRHSIAAAAGARALAEATKRDPEEAYLAGLLHDIGLAALDRAAAEAYRKVLRTAASRKADAFPALERSRLGLDHAEAARALAEAWSFPERLRDAFGGGKRNDLAPLVRAADHLAWIGGYAPFDAGSPPTPDAHARAILEAGDPEEALEAIRDEVARCAVLFGSEEVEPKSLCRVLARANAALARLAAGLDASDRSQRALNSAMLNVQERLGERDPVEALLCEIVATLGFDRACVLSLEGGEHARVTRTASAFDTGAAIERREVPGFAKTFASVSRPMRVRRGERAGFDGLLDLLGTQTAVIAPLSAGDERASVIVADRAHTAREVEDKDAGLVGPLALETGLLLENYRLVQTVRTMAVTDALTGVFNRRRLMEVLAKERERAVLTHRPLAVGIFDLDHFKRVNDTLGHATGDLVLRGFGRLLRDKLRRGDLVGRYGGEEFVVVLPGADLERGKSIAERIRAAVADFGREEAGRLKGAKISVSAGVAALVGEGESEEALLRRADEALYEAKSGGRDRVCASPAPENPPPPSLPRAPGE